MAKLSRTQKYAELRNRLENDREIDLNTANLSEYGNKLNDLLIIGHDDLLPLWLTDCKNRLLLLYANRRTLANAGGCGRGFGSVAGGQTKMPKSETFCSGTGICGILEGNS